MRKMNMQFTTKTILSAIFFALTVTGCQSLPNTSSSSTTNIPNSQVADTPVVNNSAAIAVSTGSHKLTYTATELEKEQLHNAIDISKTRLSGIATPTVNVADISYIPTIIIPKTTTSQTDLLDVSLLDDFISQTNPNARHYPPSFKSASDRYYTKEKLKELEQWLRPFAEQQDASYEVLLRAAKLNGMARNLDLGSDYAVRGSTFIAKAIDRQPNSAEANFIYGMMLSEGGGFKEGKKYLLKAASQDYKEAEQSLAQADLLSDNRSAALSRLKTLQQKYPNDPTIAQQINIVESGKYYIWDLAAQ